MEFDPFSYVFMNFVGFSAKWWHAPRYLYVLEQGFLGFLKIGITSNLLKAKYLLHPHIADRIKGGKVTVKVLETRDSWFGVTYKEDKESVIESFKKLLDDGVYQEELYSDLK